MNKLITTGLISTLFFISNVNAQTNDVETGNEYDEDKIFQACENEANRLNLEGEALELHIDDCIYANSEVIEEFDENEESTPTVNE